MRPIPALCTALLMLPTVFAVRARDTDFLPAEKAYQYEVSAKDNRLMVSWIITPGYYLARSRMGFESATPGVTLGKAVFPQGEMHRDEYFGDGEIYRGTATFEVPYRVNGAAPAEITLKLKWQGCADAGLCYPPTTWKTQVKLPGHNAKAHARVIDMSRRPIEAGLLNFSTPVAASAAAEFGAVKTSAELDQAIAAARKQSKPVMVDFTADWCAPCKKMEKTTFADPGVRASMNRFVLLRADVTEATDQDAALLKRFASPGPPLIVFFDARGREVKTCQLTGFVEAARLRKHLDTCLKPADPPS